MGNNKLKDIFQSDTDAQNNDFKSHSLKNSQSIRASKLQNQEDFKFREDETSAAPSGHVISSENILHPGGLVSQFDGQNNNKKDGVRISQPYANIKTL